MDAATLEDMKLELTEVRAARRAFMTGGAVQQAWSGRYGNRMTYDNPTLADYAQMISTLERDIAALEAELAGRPRRRAIAIGWQD